MGDCLWATPGIRAIKKTFPEIKINLLVNWMWKPLFEENPYLDEIFEYRADWYRQVIIGAQLILYLFFIAIKTLKECCLGSDHQVFGAIRNIYGYRRLTV